ncbi:MAG: putative Ig domain-containing protein [Actinobacteria bacterium]|nr:putative Ig domain-containing protein [Actinomycetota bacterium]
MRKFLGLLAAAATLLLAAPTTATAAEPLTLTVANGPLPAATLGTQYGLGITAIGGGTRPVTWSVVSGSLPPGLSVIKNWGNSSTMINGTPTRGGAYSFTLRARDKDGNSTTGSFSIQVGSGAGALSIANAGSLLVGGRLGQSYTANLFAAGGVAPYTWSISGTLPTGLTLAGNQIVGKPDVRGTWTFTLVLTDAQRTSVSKLFSIVIL